MKKILLVIALFSINTFVISQNVGINNSGNAPNTSAILDVQSSDKGVLFPRLTTTERNAIQNPTHSLMVFNTTTNCFEAWDSSVASWISFGCLWSCGGFFTDMRDNENYPTVQIGNQCWMAKNLNYNSLGSYCYADNNNNCDIYGRLYDWNTAMNGAAASNANPSGVQGVCPTGWHLPSDAEWQQMETALGMTDASTTLSWRGTNEGTQLKATSPAWNGNNSSGFTALAGGYHDANNYTSMGTAGQWWSTRTLFFNHVFRRLESSQTGVQHGIATPTSRMSVRCVKD